MRGISRESEAGFFFLFYHSEKLRACEIKTSGFDNGHEWLHSMVMSCNTARTREAGSPRVV